MGAPQRWESSSILKIGILLEEIFAQILRSIIISENLLEERALLRHFGTRSVLVNY